MEGSWRRTVPINREYKQGFVDGYDEKPRRGSSLSYIAGYDEGMVIRAFVWGSLDRTEAEWITEFRQELSDPVPCVDDHTTA